LGIDLNLAPELEDAENAPLVPNEFFLPDLNLANVENNHLPQDVVQNGLNVDDFIELNDLIQNSIVAAQEGHVSMVIISMNLGTEGSYSDGVVN
jgi:hypothetical protein